MAEATTAKSVYQTVSKLGITRAQARKLLPDWWSTDVEKQAGGIDELMMLLARRLSLDVKALSSGILEPKGAMRHVAFKRRATVAEDALTSTSHVASSVATLVASATTSPFKGIPSSAAKVAAAALKGSAGLIGFDALLKLCWGVGIPVIPLTNLPVGMRKMDGAAMLIDKRPAIILARKHKSRAWMSFILGHEIAHIALGHLDGGSIVDVSLEEEAKLSTGIAADGQEAAADAFALAVLGGEATTSMVEQWPSRLTPVEIAAQSRAASKSLGVEAGNIALRYAFITRRWTETAMALNFLTEDFDATAALVDALKQHVALEDLGEDAQEYLSQVTGATIDS